MILREYRNLIQVSGAVFSECMKYRYKLWRIWDRDSPYILFLMLNPSTADEMKNDPTVERCERRAREYGYGGIHVCNLFAYRSPSPSVMKSVMDPVGPENDRSIMDVAKDASMVVCAWGMHGTHINRSANVRGMLACRGILLHYLRITKGKPWHPLYVTYSEMPKEWNQYHGMI